MAKILKTSRQKILITGGHGYLGGRIADHLINSGHEVTLASRDPSKFHCIRFACLQINWLCDQSLREVCKGFDTVIHSAGLNSAECESDPVSAKNINGFYSKRLAIAASAAGVNRFIYLSTAHVYSTPLVGVFDEVDTPICTHPYGASKLLGENFVREVLRSSGMDGCILRLSNAIGPPLHKQANCWSLVCNDLSHQAVVAGTITLNSDGQQLRDFVGITQLNHVLEHLLSPSLTTLDGAILNIASQFSMSISELAHLVGSRCLAVLGFYPEIIVPDHSRDLKVETLIIKNSKLKKLNIAISKEIEKDVDDLLMFCSANFNS